MDLSKVSVLAVAQELLGPINPDRSTSKEKHFHGHSGLFVNVDKNLWYSHGQDQGGNAVSLVRYVQGCSVPEAFQWLEERQGTPVITPPKRSLIKTYHYHGPSGEERYHVNRYSDKSFGQWRMLNGETVWGIKGGRYRRTSRGWVGANGHDGEATELPGIEPVPYRLPDLMNSDPRSMVLIPSGEKDVDNLWELGFVATTNHGGEGKWAPGLSIWLKDRRVCILCDNDEMGEKHQATIGTALSGVAKDIRVVRFPQLPPKGDVSDWLDERYKAGATKPKVIAELKRMCSEAQRWSPTGAPQAFKITSLADIQSAPIDWLWEGYLAKGKLTLLGGDPNQGKSNLTIDIAARLSVGKHLPFGARPLKPSSTIFLCSEDGLADTIKPRTEAAGADPHMLYAFGSAILRHGKVNRFTLGNDLDMLGTAVEEVKASLVVIDAITSYMGKVEHTSTTDIRAVLDPISEWAERFNVAVLGVTHPPKASQSNAIRQFTGSFAFVAAARLAFYVTSDPDSDRSLLLAVKNNIGQMALGRGYRIGSKEVSHGIIAPYIMWDDAPVDYTADEAVAASRRSTSKLSEAKEFLMKYLKEGPQPCDTCRGTAGALGFSEATLRRAREELRIRVIRGGNEPDMWALADTPIIQLAVDNDFNDD